MSRESNRRFSNMNPEGYTLSEIREMAYKQGKYDAIISQANHDEAVRQAYREGFEDAVKLYHKYVEKNLEVNTVDILINDEIKDAILSKSVEEVLKNIEQIKDKGTEK